MLIKTGLVPRIHELECRKVNMYLVWEMRANVEVHGARSFAQRVSISLVRVYRKLYR